ncbi:hypothetical protein FHS21_002553 [Phyllobacterium trifolii]|jgi:hypothetical protein|uniref:Uncharacterized protein n=1 Tax=Phyllobacterium trifolii TaxID=300193 RepID=A0A839U5Y2_9HYPH|nr:hypothetical protein [Phyllobacterium trifolii]MBB3146138.1 hypothetical protein [Phyllobacterium trifolii]
MFRDGISRDLINCAKDASSKSAEDKRALLMEASQAIEWGAKLVALSGLIVEEGALAGKLASFAYGIEFRYDDETAEIMHEAAAAIRTLRLLLGLQRESY